MRFENPLGPDEDTVALIVDVAALSLINNALNEVCNGLHISDQEFATRLGPTRAEARRLLDSVGSMLDDLAALE